MKIAFVSQPFDFLLPHPFASSISIWTQRVIEHIQPNEHRYLVYAREDSRTDIDAEKFVGFKWVDTRIDDRIARVGKFTERLLGYPKRNRPYFSSSTYYGGYARKIAQDLARQDCDIIHVHNFSQFVPVIRAFNPRAKIVLHMHCEWLSQLDRSIIEHRLKDVDLVIGCSDYIVTKVRARLPEIGRRCQVVYNGVDNDIFLQRNGKDALPDKSQSIREDKRVLFVGRVSPEKGLHDLLSAFELVQKAIPNTCLDIVGSVGSSPYEFIVMISEEPSVMDLSVFYDGLLKSDNYYNYLKQHLFDHLAEHVEFAGPVSHERVIDFYNRADVLVNPSLSEAFGMSLVEAMASETPVVATRTGGMPEIVENGVTGLLVDPADPDQLAAAILRILDNQELGLSMGKAGRIRAVEHFSWNKIAADLLELYQGLLN